MIIRLVLIITTTRLGEPVKIEIANDSKSREEGLMFRSELEEDSGMLFVFDEVSQFGFWGKNTYIPLDVAFITEDKKIASIREIVPKSFHIVRCDTSCKYGLEANSGYFEMNGVEVGDCVKIDGDQLTFVKKDKS